MPKQNHMKYHTYMLHWRVMICRTGSRRSHKFSAVLLLLPREYYQCQQGEMQQKECCCFCRCCHVQEGIVFGVREAIWLNERRNRPSSIVDAVTAAVEGAQRKPTKHPTNRIEYLKHDIRHADVCRMKKFWKSTMFLPRSPLDTENGHGRPRKQRVLASTTAAVNATYTIGAAGIVARIHSRFILPFLDSPKSMCALRMLRL